MLQAGRSQVRDLMRRMVLSIYLIPLSALCPEDYSASNRNEYQREK
jgi:hypothetical protein